MTTYPAYGDLYYGSGTYGDPTYIELVPTFSYGLLESTGYGALGPKSESLMFFDQGVNLLGIDAHSPADAATASIPANDNGTPTRSYERWIRVRFVPPFGAIKNFKFWMTPATFAPGWSLLWGFADTYAVPVNGVSQIATQPVPTAEPAAPNLGTTQLLTGQRERTTPYIVLQAQFTPDQTQLGHIAGPRGITFNVGFDVS